MKKYSLVLLLLLNALVFYGQKAQKTKFVGFYKNIPQYDLNIGGYDVSYILTDYVQKIADRDTLGLEIKGFEKGGTDIKLALLIGEPHLTDHIQKEEKMVNGKKLVFYTGIVSAEAESRLIVLNSEGLPVIQKTAEPGLFLVENKSTPYGKWIEADKYIKDTRKAKSDNIKIHYVLNLFDAYQEVVDNLFGKFERNEKLRIYTIKGKNFNYDDFNEATLAFQEATSQLGVTSSENQEKIRKSIDVWSKYAQEYQPGKKSRVCDVNIDDINYNLLTGYLALGEGTEINKYWDKRFGNLGQYSLGSMYETFMQTMMENFALNQEQEGKLPEPMKFVSDEEKFNNMVFLNGIFSVYLNTKWRDSYLTINDFPSQTEFLKSADITKKYGADSFERIKLTYEMYSRIKTMEYSTENGYNDDKTYEFSFVYGKYGVGKVFLPDDRCIYSVSYEDKKISKIVYNNSTSKKIIYNFIDDEEGKLIVKVSYEENGIIKNEKKEYYISYDKNYNILSYRLPFSSVKEQIFDPYGNVSGWQFVNPNTDVVSDISFDLKTDKRGNAEQVKLNDEYEMKAEYEYYF